MDVALVLDQVENRAFDPSQASVHDGLSVDANLGSLNPRSKRYCSVVRRMQAEILPSIRQSVQNGQFVSGLAGLFLARFD